MPGTYTFRPIQANLTHDTDWLGKMDPYCSYRVGSSRVKGPVCRNGGKFPKWEDATVNVPAVNEPSMVVDLMDKDKILFDDNIGSFVIDLMEIQSRGRVSKWYPVYYHKKPAGEILMEAAFTPELIQHQVIAPVTIKETTIVEPVLVEKVIVEEVHQAPIQHIPVQTIPVQHHVHQEFHSGPIIHGTSQIHHQGQGIGLVPQHGGVLQQGVSHQQGTILHQGVSHQQGTILHQGVSHQQDNILHQGVSHQQGTILHQGIPQQQGTILHQGSNLNQQGLIQPNLNQGLHQQKF